MKKTAVEWLVEQIDDMYIHQLYEKEFNQAKEMEKQQIFESHHRGYKDGECFSAEQYYNETFKQQTPWYDEDQTTKRMDVVAQNGNDGEHYNNK